MKKGDGNNVKESFENPTYVWLSHDQYKVSSMWALRNERNNATDLWQLFPLLTIQDHLKANFHISELEMDPLLNEKSERIKSDSLNFWLAYVISPGLNWSLISTPWNEGFL